MYNGLSALCFIVYRNGVAFVNGLMVEESIFQSKLCNVEANPMDYSGTFSIIVYLKLRL